VAIVVTLVVLLIDASIKSRSDTPVRTLSSQAWVDQVLPILGETISQGDEINQLRNESVVTSASTILPELEGVAVNATQALSAAQALATPVAIAVPRGYLIICLQTRVQAAQALSAAMQTALTGNAGDAVSQIQKATALFQVADQAYSLFIQGMPPLGVSLPASVWLSNPGEFSTASLSIYLQTLRNARSPLPVHQLQVEAVTTMPPAVSEQGSGANLMQILPLADTISVQVTVGDLGNQTETGIFVTASLQPSVPGYASSQRYEVGSIQQGQSLVVPMPELKAPTEVPVTLTVTISAVGGQTNASQDTKSIVFLMAKPNTPIPTTTSTTTVPPSTTAPAGGAATGSVGPGSTTTTTSG